MKLGNTKRNRYTPKDRPTSPRKKKNNSSTITKLNKKRDSNEQNKNTYKKQTQNKRGYD